MQIWDALKKIDFVDDERKTTPNGIDVVGTTQDIDELTIQYSNIIVAIVFMWTVMRRLRDIALYLQGQRFAMARCTNAKTI